MLTTGVDNEVQSPTTLGWTVVKGELISDTNAPGWLRLDKPRLTAERTPDSDRQWATGTADMPT